MDHKSNGDSFGSRLPTSGAERYSGPYTPYGRAEPCASPISPQEIQALLSELAMLAPLQGAWTISADGLPVAILHAHSEAHFRLLREKIAEVLAWGWNGVFGTMVSFTLAGKDPQSEAFSRMLVAQDNPFVSRFKEFGRAAFAAGWRGNVGKFFMTDFGNHPTYGNSPLIGFRNLAEFVEPKEFFFRDDELSYWQLMGMPTMHWAKGLSHAEIARAAWARDFEGDLHAFWNGLDETRTLLRDGSREEVAPVVTGGRAVYPGLFDLAAVIADEKKSFADTFFWMEALVVDEMRLSDVLYGLLDGKAEVDEHVRQFIAFGLACALHGPRVTAYGTRKPWLSARNPKHTVQTLFTPVDLRKVGSKEGLNAETYWPISGVFEAFDVGACITGSDIPMNRSRLAAELGPHVLDSSVDEAHRIIASVLIEAGEHRKWSAPWGARVQISFGPLKWMDVFELEGEFIVLFRDTQEHYLACSMNVVNSTFACHGIFEGEEPAEREDIEAALLLIAASAVRDFLVVEERQSVLGCRTLQGQRGRCATNSDLSVVYLPRVKYTRPSLGAISEILGEFRPRAAHAVAAHLRSASHPSSVQLLLAQRYGVTVPTGYTFVRPHRRGDQQATERLKIYRSRSASALLYESISAPAGSRPRWFDFERDVANYLKVCGLVVVHQAANRNGDGGIDIYAHRPEMDAIVAIQCKCYAVAKKVGPDVIREVKGALFKYPEGTVGRVMTTSSFTDGAIKEAALLGIELVDGKAWAAMLGSAC